MERLVVVVVLAVIAVVVATVIQRRQPASSPANTGYNVPDQLHRPDFVRPGASWLVVVFTSSTCSTCAGTWQKAQVLESDVVATQEVEVGSQPELHRRYAIDGVPTTVVADRDGVVQASFLGPATATDLWAAVAELREPGSVPPECESHVHPAGTSAETAGDATRSPD